jgi:tellurite resistance protein TehA-like permease
MKFEGRTKILVFAIIAAVGISGLVEAIPHASESIGDLLFDAAIVAGIILISALFARWFGRRGAAPRQ